MQPEKSNNRLRNRRETRAEKCDRPRGQGSSVSSMCALASAPVRSRRRGVIALELLIIIPVLFIGTLAVFEFALLGVAMQMVAHAAHEGARTSALIGGDTTAVLNRIDTILAVQGIAVTGGQAGVRIEDSGSSTDHGNLGIIFDPRVNGPAPVAGDVRVTVMVPLLIANHRPVPNWLAGFGFDWGNMVLHYSAMTREE